MEKLSKETLKELAKFFVATSLPRVIEEKRGENHEQDNH
jgi:hypothetical protein